MDFIKAVSFICIMALFCDPLYALEPNYRLADKEFSLFDINTSQVENEFPVGDYLLAGTTGSQQSGSSSGGGVAQMVLGIVFTPITAILSLGFLIGYSSAQEYDCDWAQKEGREDGTMIGERFKESREQCHKDRREHMATMGTLAGASLIGLAISIYSIVRGATKIHNNRRAKFSEEEKFGKFDLVYSGNKDFIFAWNYSL